MVVISIISIINILVGLLLIFLGRRLYWFFVGAIGFIAGISLAPMLFNISPDWVMILVAILIGFVGALLAVVVQGLAIGIAGFLGGGYLVLALLDIIDVSLGQLAWLPVLAGAIVGAILVIILFDWALIILSSLVGAGIIAQTLGQLFQIGPVVLTIIFAALAIFGLVYQAVSKPREMEENEEIDES